MLATQNGFPVLIHNQRRLDYSAVFLAFWVWVFVLDLHFGVDGVTYVNRPEKTKLVVTEAEGNGIYNRRGQSDTDGKNHRTVGNTLAECLGFAPLGVHVVRKEVTTVPGMRNNISFGNGATESLPFRADLIVLEILLHNHSSGPIVAT